MQNVEITINLPCVGWDGGYSFTVLLLPSLSHIILMWARVCYDLMRGSNCSSNTYCNCIYRVIEKDGRDL